MTDPLYKRCARCGEIKPSTAFHKDGLEKDGRNKNCSACVNAYWRRIRAIRKTQPPGPPRSLLAFLKDKRCVKCGETKPVAEFYRDKGHRGGFERMCKICRLALNRNRQRRQLEKISKGSDALAEILPPIPAAPIIPGSYRERVIDDAAPMPQDDDRSASYGPKGD